MKKKPNVVFFFSLRKELSERLKLKMAEAGEEIPQIKGVM